MIDFIDGKIEEISENKAVISAGGVGFGVNISLNTYYALKEEKAQVRLYTYMNVRENVIELFGFAAKEEKKIFLLLIEVEGIGARAATGILGKVSPEKLKSAIAAGNEAALTAIPGLGPKKAQRIIIELKDKFKDIAVTDAAPYGEEGGEYAEVLVRLGFQAAKAREVIREVMRDNKGAGQEKIIKEALKRLG